MLLINLEQAAQRRLRRRHVQEKRQQGLVEVVQTWHRLDGEALCVTPGLIQTWPGRDPAWLALDRQPAPAGARTASRWLPLPGWRRARLERRAEWSLLALLARWVRWPRWATPETRKAGLLLRLERHGLPIPTVLGMGQTMRPWGWTDSFLLTEPAADALRLDLWLQRQKRPGSVGVPHSGDRQEFSSPLPCTRGRGVGGEGAAPGQQERLSGRQSFPLTPDPSPPSTGERGDFLRERREVLQRTGALLARLHQSCCYLTPSAEIGLLAVQLSAEPHRILLRDVAGIEPARAPSLARARRDLERLRHWLVEAGCGPDDLVPVDLGYRQQLTSRDAPVPKEASACRV